MGGETKDGGGIGLEDGGIMPAVDNFKEVSAMGWGMPATRIENVTPHDTNELTNASRWLFVGGAGAIRVKTVGGDTVTLTGVIAGSVLPIRAVQVLATGTTATNICALS